MALVTIDALLLAPATVAHVAVAHADATILGNALSDLATPSSLGVGVSWAMSFCTKAHGSARGGLEISPENFCSRKRPSACTCSRSRPRATPGRPEFSGPRPTY